MQEEIQALLDQALALYDKNQLKMVHFYLYDVIESLRKALFFTTNHNNT